jgi:PAS domain S-box-containing protein
VPQRRIEIVLIDDAVDVRRVVARQLQLSRRFSIVAEGGTGLEAIELAAAHRPALLLLDVSMPDMDGLNALPAIRQASPETRVVMFSGFSGQDLLERARVLGATDFIEKSLPIRELPGRLLRVVDRDASSDPAAADPAETDRAQEEPGEPRPTAQRPRTRPAPAAVSAPASSAPASSAPASSAPGSSAPESSAETPPDLAAQEVFVEHLERFRDVFERATVGMATLTLTGTIVRWNDAFAAIVDSGSDLVGRTYLDLADPDTAADLHQATRAVIAGEDRSRAVEHHLAQGNKWVRSTIATVRDRTSRPLYLFLQVEDITAGRLAQEALRQSEERFGLLVSSVVDYAILILDPDGHVVTWNAGAQRIKGWTAEEILGQHFRVFYTDEAQAAHHPERELEMAASQGRYEEEDWRVRKDGSRFWGAVVITKLLDGAGHLVGFAKVTRDVTHRRQAMDALAEAKEMYAAAAAEKGRFLAIAAHELRSPTTSVSAAASMLRGRWDDLDEGARAELLDVLANGSGRIRRLVEDMLLASQLEERGLRYNLEAVDLAASVAMVIRSLPDLPPVEERVPPGAAVLADAVRLAQILTNLLLNAAAYGDPPVVVEVTDRAEEPVIRVIDAGAGVGEALVDRLFTPFTRGTGRPDRGTGLGLFIVRELARGMGGDAWYERHEGRTAFAVRLPPVREAG